MVLSNPNMAYESHAMCVRGLKHLTKTLNFWIVLSHAMCVRGLKRLYLKNPFAKAIVARHVRAWIETIFY